MGNRFRFAVVAVTALAIMGLVAPTATARRATVPRVSNLAPAGIYLGAAKLGVKWKKVTGATYQVRWASSTKRLKWAKVYSTRKTSAISPRLNNVCINWYAQVRAKKRGKFGAWSRARGLRFSGVAGVPAADPIITGQTSTSEAQVRWVRTPGAVGYRLHYSPGPYGNWPGYFPYTATTSATTSSLSIPLPPVGPGDRFMGPEYGNAVFAQLETKRCTGYYTKAPFVPVFPMPAPPGDATTGDPLAIGSYNVELFPTASDVTKMANLADNIASANLDVVVLQEATGTTADDLAARLAAAESQTDWVHAAIGDTGGVNQQVMYRSGRFTEVSSSDIGASSDGTAATPLPTPLVRLSPTDPDPSHQDIVVVGVHLEDRTKFDGGATIPERKADAHAAAEYLLAAIAAANTEDLPVIAAGDFKGNFGGGGDPGDGYCDESSTPACQPEGQPTFIRGGFIDAQGAVTKVGIQYGTVNKHVADQPAANSGVAGRADFIVVKGFTGIDRYENVKKAYGSAGPTEQSDHNLIFANLFIPHGS